MINTNSSKLFKWIKNQQNGLCIKLSVTIFVCVILCFTCFFVENSYKIEVISPDKLTSEKLIQIKWNNLRDKSIRTVQKTNGQDMQNSRVLSEDDGSGNYADTQNPIFDTSQAQSQEDISTYGIGRINHIGKIFKIPRNGPDLGSVFKTDSTNNKCNRLANKLPTLTESESRNCFRGVPPSTSFMSNSNLVSAIEKVPNNMDTKVMNNEPNSQDSISIGTFADVDNTPAISVWESEERYFPTEHAYDDDFIPSQEVSDEFILSNYDNGDYIQLKETVTSTEKNYMPSPPPQLTSLFNTFFNKMSSLFVPTRNGAFLIPSNIYQPSQDHINHINSFKRNTVRNDNHFQVQPHGYQQYWSPQESKEPKNSNNFVKFTM